MRKSKSFLVLLFLAVLFLATAVAYTLSGTFANEIYVPAELIAPYNAGKVEPPGWCLEHGYFGEEYLDCRYCD